MISKYIVFFFSLILNVIHNILIHSGWAEEKKVNRICYCFENNSMDRVYGGVAVAVHVEMDENQRNSLRRTLNINKQTNRISLIEFCSIWWNWGGCFHCSHTPSLVGFNCRAKGSCRRAAKKCFAVLFVCVCMNVL